MKVQEALAEVMRSVPAVRKEDRNSAQNFNFRGIDAVLNAVGPALRAHGVVVAPQIVSHHHETITVGQRGTQMRSVVVIVHFTFHGPEGDTIEVEVPGEAMDSGDKAYSKAMSVAFRTALLQTLALPTDERDPDADAFERVAPKSPLELALGELRALITEKKLDGKAVAAEYVTEQGVEITVEANPENIREFTKKLAAAHAHP